jgi:hypothetical protein
MRPKNLYLGLCLIGTVLPYSQFVPFLRENGLDARAFLEQYHLLSRPLGHGGRGGPACRSRPSVGSDRGQPGGRRVAGAPAVPLHARSAA